MKLHYDPDTDSLYIDFNARPGADAREITDGLVVDFDAEGRPVGIDIQHASRDLDLSTLETQALPTLRVKLGRDCTNGPTHSLSAAPSLRSGCSLRSRS
jgi:uncharacterized protein YuzE